MSTNKYTKFWKKKHKGRFYIRWREDGSRKQFQQQESRWLWEKHFGKIPTGYHIHHKDKNPLNNDINNLECLSAEDHKKIHNRSKNFINNGIEYRPCAKCLIDKKLNEYYKMKDGNYGGYCIDCTKERFKKYRDNDEFREKARIKAKINRIKNRKTKKCPICKKNECLIDSKRCRSCSIKEYLRQNPRLGDKNPNWRGGVSL